MDIEENTNVAFLRRKRVYVAGPFSSENVIQVFENMRKGIQACSNLLRMGYAPFCPWLDHQFILVSAHSVDPGAIGGFYEYGLSWLQASDCVLVLDGWQTSKGTLYEIERARDMNIPVYFDLSELGTSIGLDYRRPEEKGEDQDED